MSEAANKITKVLAARANEIADALKMRVGREAQRMAADIGSQVDEWFKGLIDEINGDVSDDRREED